MKQVFIQKGNAIIEDVPGPLISDNEILVQVYYSCISVGTEISGIKRSGRSLIAKALERPQDISKILENIKASGIKNTISKVRSKVEAKSPVGYSASGIVLEKGSNIKAFKKGDMVACAGAGIANHAEFISVPENLTVKIPDGLSIKLASTVTLGSIALQGIRRCSPNLGENVTVVGLGILGQLAVQMLKVNGCRVIGIDIEQSRIDKALSLGMDIGMNSTRLNIVDEVIRNTNGFGSDYVIITASSQSDEIINQAMEICRKKGKVIVVGAVNLNLKREEFYKKEIDLLISTSYGPGRYDDEYENRGVDYPYAYIRWTENRNMKAYLDMLLEKRIDLESIIEKTYKVEDAQKAYEELKESTKKPLITILEYNKESKINNILETNKYNIVKDKINVGVIGAGGFSRGVHLPNLKNMSDLFAIAAICSKTGSNAGGIAREFGAAIATTDYREIIKNKDIDMVIISTRHNLHAKIAIDASKAGKAIYLEKPMALNKEELNELANVLETMKTPFIVGFNRRFSPFAERIKDIISSRVNPVLINYRMNAGFIPKDHWVHKEEGGGRNIGEACHIYDLFNYFTECKVLSVKASGISPKTEQYNSNDNFIAVIKYEDGSVCNLIYTSLGTPEIPKEQMEIYFDNKILFLNDYKTLEIYGSGEKGITLKKQDKGQSKELMDFGNSLKDNKIIIPLWQLVQATDISFEVEKQINEY